MLLTGYVMKALRLYDTPEKKYVKYFLVAWIVMVGFYVAVIPFALVEMVAVNVEVWFTPKAGGSERKLIEQSFNLEAWER